MVKILSNWNKAVAKINDRLPLDQPIFCIRTRIIYWRNKIDKRLSIRKDVWNSSFYCAKDIIVLFVISNYMLSRLILTEPMNR